MSVLFFKAALAAYGLSSLGYLSSLVIRRVAVAKASTWVLLAGFGAHTLSHLIGIYQTGYGVIDVYDSLSFVAWAVSGIYLGLQLKTKTRILGAIVAPAALVLMVLGSAGMVETGIVPEALRGSLVPVHVTLSLIGEALFALACFAGIMYLVQESFLKSKHVNNLSRVLPPLHDLDRINHLCLVWGFLFLTAGVIAGALWARTVWGSPWSWDPKQVWTLAAWLAYAVTIHQRLAIGWSGRKSAILSIMAFLILLFTFGVSLALSSVHRFV